MSHNCIDCQDECGVCDSMNRHPAGKGFNAAQESFEEAVQETSDVNVRLLLSKHRDYGPRNISESPGGALNGLRVRMHDKLARINHLIDTGVDPQHESLYDSFMDLANYALIAQLVIRGEWPK